MKYQPSDRITKKEARIEQLRFEISHQNSNLGGHHVGAKKGKSMDRLMWD